jgi:hypothetical protein
VAENVAVPVHDTPLPGCVGKELGNALGKSDTGIGDDQPDAVQATLFEMFEESTPASLVLLGALADAENLPITLAVHADCQQQRDVANFAGTAALEYNAVQVNIRVLALDRPIVRISRRAALRS